MVSNIRFKCWADISRCNEIHDNGALGYVRSLIPDSLCAVYKTMEEPFMKFQEVGDSLDFFSSMVLINADVEQQLRKIVIMKMH